MTDPRVTAAARVLNKRHAEMCNVNEADSWAIQGSDFIEDARAAIAAADAALAARPEPPGDDYHLVWVKNFGALCDALDRATRKGYMPDAMADAWEEFDYRAAQPVAAPARPLTECADNDSPWLVCEPCAAAGKCAKAQPVAEQDALDAARYRALRRGQHWSVIDGIGDVLRADTLDTAIDAAQAKPAGGAK